MGWVLGLAIVGLVVVLAAIGIAPWLAVVPVAILVPALVFVVPLLAARERGGGARSGTPSTREASYEPVTDPSER